MLGSYRFIKLKDAENNRMISGTEVKEDLSEELTSEQRLK